MRPYYIFSNGRIMRKENTVYIENEKGEKKGIPIEDIDVLHLFAELDLNTKFLNFLSQQNKLLHIYNYYGYYAGSFMPRQKDVSGELVVKQVMHYLDNEKRFYLAKCFVEGAIFHTKRNLREYEGTEEVQKKIEEEMLGLQKAESIPELMSYEGRVKDCYYHAFNIILKNDFKFIKRERQPPSDPLNALISFGNSLVYTTVLSEIYHTQLNPTVSYLHEPRERRYSLSLDISEIFKPLICDPIIFKLVNNNMLKNDDFEEDVECCYLTATGRKKFLKEFDEKISSTVKHRKLKRNVSYRTIIRLECYKLIKHFLEDETYVPFKAWW
ncbi:MAG: type I-B CRISPR-associated endonuclease Cas1b [Candidatus Omnitrophica bacterium]|nr:type I-B CRISPR-associated endonuclease Cas1b [Candidatus Omnitrophota bacterium]